MTGLFKQLSWDRMEGLLPAIVQDSKTGAILMLGYMNQEALQKTVQTKYVTFYSRSKKRLWTKGEVSGNKLELIKIISDCDNDALLILAKPQGPICHLGNISCFKGMFKTDLNFLKSLEELIQTRDELRPEKSYTTTLLNSGIHRITQKVGEEAIEVVIAALGENNQNFCQEVADLLFHLLVLLRAKKLILADVIEVLKARMK